MKNERLDLIPEDHKFNCGNCTAKAPLILQKVKAGDVRIGQKVKFPGEKTWLKVLKKTPNRTVLRKGTRVSFVSFNWVLLQKPFDNLEENHAK